MFETDQSVIAMLLDACGNWPVLLRSGCPHKASSLSALYVVCDSLKAELPNKTITSYSNYPYWNSNCPLPRYLSVATVICGLPSHEGHKTNMRLEALRCTLA